MQKDQTDQELKSTWNTGQVEQEEEMPSLIMLDDPELLGCCAPSTQAKFDDTDLAAAVGTRSNQRPEIKWDDPKCRSSFGSSHLISGL